MLNQALEALKTYDWGQDKAALDPIENAVVATHDDAGARKELETKLAAVLKADVSFDAKQYVCRKLMVIGTAVSVPALAALLTDAKLAHSARYALERITAPEAAAALRDALATTKGDLKIGVIGSLGVRGESDAVASLGALLGDSDASIARAAALALGAIGCEASAKALAKAKPTDPAVADSLLACAEGFVAANKKVQALAIYKSLLAAKPPKHIKLAVTGGMLKCAGK